LTLFGASLQHPRPAQLALLCLLPTQHKIISIIIISIIIKITKSSHQKNIPTQKYK
jgi:hypothetical protein